MIRFLLLTLIPLIVPFAAWYIWKVFSGTPRIDPTTGDQAPPNLEIAPHGKLLGAGFLLMILTVGIFLFVHDQFAETPYKALDVDRVEESEKRQPAGEVQKNSK
ncbi:MAG: hypothetical protein VYA17_10440 [Pseudomonadota bacterium]|nr:hypothetical protein [Pseudomonadota bacterium]